MKALRTVENVTGPTLTINVPADFAGTQVEVIVLPLSENEQPPLPELDPRYARYIMRKPPLSEEDNELFARNPYPLRGMASQYLDPFEPVVPPQDWEALGQ